MGQYVDTFISFKQGGRGGGEGRILILYFCLNLE